MLQLTPRNFATFHLIFKPSYLEVWPRLVDGNRPSLNPHIYATHCFRLEYLLLLLTN